MTMLDLPALQDKLLARMMRERWEVWLWTPENTWQSRRGGWVALEYPDERRNFTFDRAEAEAGMAMARATYGPDAVLKLMHWSVEECR